MEKLEPCPFCKSTKLLTVVEEDFAFFPECKERNEAGGIGSIEVVAYIECDVCNARGYKEVLAGGTPIYEAVEYALKSWNRRA